MLQKSRERIEPKRIVGGFVFISTHFSLERGFGGKVVRVFAGCRVSLSYLFFGFVVSTVP